MASKIEHYGDERMRQQAPPKGGRSTRRLSFRQRVEKKIEKFAFRRLGPLARAGKTWKCALLLHVNIYRISRPAHSSGRRVRFLLLDKAMLREDVEASIGGRDGVELFGINRSLLKSLANGMLPKEIQNDTDYHNEGAKIELQKQRFRGFLGRLWSRLTRLRRYDAVLTSSYFSYAEIELAGALEELGMPFIALHKENIVSAGCRPYLNHAYKFDVGSFAGRRIIICNEQERRAQIESGVALPERFRLCGMPRLDRNHRWRLDHAGEQVLAGRRPTVAFFAFNPTDQIPTPYDAEKAKTWAQLCRLTFKALHRLADETPEIDVIVKPRFADRRLVYDFLVEDGPLPDNLWLEPKRDPFDLISTSQVVSGFNSTTVFEAIASGKPIVVPRFAEAADDQMVPFVIDYEDAVEYADSPETLIGMLRDRALAPLRIPLELTECHNRVLDKFLFNSDGAASERVAEAIFEELDLPVPVRRSSF